MDTPEFLALPTMTEVAQTPGGSPPKGSTVEEQPWVIIPTSELEGALAKSGARAVMIDPQLAEGSARG